MEQLWMGTLLLLWFALGLWSLLDNLMGCSGKACEWMDCFLSSVRAIVILTESITNTRNIVCCVGTNTDFSGWILNPSSRKGATVALILLKQISKVSPSNKDSSIYFTDKYPFDLRYLNGGVKTFVKTLTAGKNPFGRRIYW